MKNILCFGVGLLFMGMTSCYFSKLTSKRKSDFTHRLEEVSTDFLRFEGYYEFSYPAADLWKLDFHLSLKFPSCFFIFYPDGTFATDFYFYQNKTEEDIAKDLKSCLYQKVTSKRRGAWAFSWGVYKVEDSLLLLQGLSTHPSRNRYVFFEASLKRGPSDTLLWIQKDFFYRRKRPATVMYMQQGIFHPADSIPPPDTWLKDFPWIWKEADGGH